MTLTLSVNSNSERNLKSVRLISSRWRNSGILHCFHSVLILLIHNWDFLVRPIHFRSKSICQTLWCQNGGRRCESKFIPAAEGTPCGPNKVSDHTFCIFLSSLQPTDDWLLVPEVLGYFLKPEPFLKTVYELHCKIKVIEQKNLDTSLASVNQG